MAWLQSFGIIYGLLVIVTGLVVWALVGREEKEEFPFRPLRKELADKLRTKDAQLASSSGTDASAMISC